MIFMVTTIAIAVVGFFWVKTRRQRKHEAASLGTGRLGRT